MAGFSSAGGGDIDPSGTSTFLGLSELWLGYRIYLERSAHEVDGQ